jgi:predicted nucleotidyltransferase
MNRDEVIAVLKAHQPELMAIGILHAGLFGSVARGEQTAESDIDIMIDIDPTVRLSIFDYAGIKLQVADLFFGDVDVINRRAIRPEIKHTVYEDLIDAF